MSYLEIKQVEHMIGKSLILPKLSFAVSKGDFVCLLGPSGSGKTTLLRLIAGLEPLQSGTIMLDQYILSGPNDMVSPDQRSIGMVFQQPTLFPTMTVKDNIGFGLKNEKADKREKRVKQLLKHIGLSHRADAYPHELSGGQQHRVALARAMAPKQKLLLLDEPFSHLDPQLRAALSRDTLALVKEEGVTCIMVTHDAPEAMKMGDKIVLFDAEGHIRQHGTAHDIYYHPVDQYAALALGDINLFQAKSDGRKITSSIGEFDSESNVAGEVTLGIRPQHCKVNGQESGLGATIRQVTCTGPEDHLQLELKTGEFIQASMEHEHHFKVGDEVGVTIKENEVLFFPQA